MAIFEIWKSKTSVTLIDSRSVAENRRRGLIEADEELFCSFHATTQLEANQKYHTIMGFGPYSPMLKDDGTPEDFYFDLLDEEV